MSKSLKKAIIALVVLAVFVGGYFVAKHFIDKNKPQDDPDKPEETAVTILSYNPNDVIEIDAENDEAFTLKKGEDGLWRCTQPEGVSATDSAITNITVLLNEMMGNVVYKEGEYKGDLAQFGLTNPAKLTLKMKSGESYTLLTGREAPSGLGYYFMLDGSDAIYTVASVFARKLILDRTDLMTGNLMEFAETGKIKNISIEKNGEKLVDIEADFTVKTDDANKGWNITYPLKCQANPTEVNGLIETVTGLSVYDIAEAEGANLADYGLDNPALRVTMEDNKGVQTFALGNKEGKYYYCTVGQSTAVFKVSAENITFIDNNALSYAYAYPFFENYTNLSKIEIELFGDVNEKHEMTFQFGEDSEKLMLDGQPSKEYDKKGNEIYNYDYEFKGITTYCYAIQLDGLEPEMKYEKGDLLLRITYTRKDGSKSVVETYEREEGTMYIFSDGVYFGGYSDKWRAFSREDHQGLIGTILAYKKLLNS